MKLLILKAEIGEVVKSGNGGKGQSSTLLDTKHMNSTEANTTTE